MKWLQNSCEINRRLLILFIFLLTVGATLWDVMPPTVDAAGGNLLTNGDFERGFTYRDGCGHVGIGWNCFTNRGRAVYGFYDEEWPPVVASGRHSLLIEINTKGLGAASDDRYAGISQSVRVQTGAIYEIAFQGMIRTTNIDNVLFDPWRYRVQFGYTTGRNADWRTVNNWVDVGWDAYDLRLKPTDFNNFRARLLAQEPDLTIFIRIWKKWGSTNEEIDINLDNITLTVATRDETLLPTLTPTPINTRSPLQLPVGTPVNALPTLAPPTASQNNPVRLPTGPSATAYWPRLFGEYIAFSYPGSWKPALNPLGGNAILEEFALGVPSALQEQTLGFSSVPFGELRPPDVVAVYQFEVGGKEGVKWFRQNPTYIAYQYCTTGPNDLGSFCVRVALPTSNRMVELQLDALVQSIVFK